MVTLASVLYPLPAPAIDGIPATLGPRSVELAVIPPPPPPPRLERSVQGLGDPEEAAESLLDAFAEPDEGDADLADVPDAQPGAGEPWEEPTVSVPNLSWAGV